MNAQLRELLKPEVLNTVSGLELVARIVVEGFMSGSNKSQSMGAGQEFSQYRSYEPGDDLRQLDWKMFARSGRYFIKQAEIETNITVKFMLDASRSMAMLVRAMTVTWATRWSRSITTVPSSRADHHSPGSSSPSSNGSTKVPSGAPPMTRCLSASQVGWGSATHERSCIAVSTSSTTRLVEERRELASGASRDH